MENKHKMSIASVYTNLPVRWIDKDGYIYIRQDVSDAPSKDYYQLKVKIDLTVSLKLWKVAPPFKATTSMAPTAYYSTSQYFRSDNIIRSAIESRLRGELDFLDNLFEGRFHFLDHMNKTIQLNIISFLDVCSVLRLSVTSSHFKRMCNENSIWKRHFMSGFLRYYATPQLMEIVDQQGWKTFYIIMRRIAESTDEVGTKLLLKKVPSGENSKNRTQTSSRRNSNTPTTSSMMTFVGHGRSRDMSNISINESSRKETKSRAKNMSVIDSTENQTDHDLAEERIQRHSLY